MKKMLIIAFAALMLFACGRETTFTIVGTMADTELEGKLITMRIRVDGVIVSDTARIIDGKYTFTGSIETPTLAQLTINGTDGNRLRFISLILERGIINVATDTDGRSTITGTRYNAIRQPFLDSEYAFKKEADGLSLALEEAMEAGDTELSDFLSEKSFKYWNEWKGVIVEFILSNINNPAGQAQFRLDALLLELEQRQEIIASANKRTLQIPEIAAIVERTETLVRTAVGQPFVDITMPDPNGNYISISDFVGDGYLMIDFTATWCGPCRQGKPKMIETFNRFSDRGFNIIGVWFDYSHEEWINVMAALNMPDWPQMSDLQGWNSKGRTLYGVNSVPYFVLIDPNGIIIHRGNVNGNFLNRKLEELLGE